MLWLDPRDPGRIRLSLHLFGGEFWIKKQVPDFSLGQTTVGGSEAYWLAAPHRLHFPLRYRNRVPANNPESRWVDQPTLVWTDGEITYRLEADVTLDEARAIAESLR